MRQFHTPENGRGRFFIFILLFCTSLFSLVSQISFSLSEWDLGEIQADSIFSRDLEISNTGEIPVKVSLMSTCGCLTVSPQEFILEPGSGNTVALKFDSSDDTGGFEKIVILRSTHPDLPKAFYMVRGVVIRNGISETEEISETGSGMDGSDLVADTSSAGEFSFDYYYSPSCRECSVFLSEELPELSREFGLKINAEKKDITEPGYYEELVIRLERLGIESKAFPVIIADNHVLQGERDIDKNMVSLIRGTLENRSNTGFTDKKEGVLLFSVLAAGLLDGINPCAFTTLIFLLTALAIAGKSRREIVIIGVFFTVSVYITYFLVGLGFFRILRMADSFNTISQIIRWLLVTVLVLFAFLSLYDYFKIRSKRASEIILQLPKGMKKRIHKSVRTYTRSTALVGSSIIMGFLVSIFELGCTGQIYFPTIIYMIKTEGKLSGYFLLGLYNLAFIVPLILVFFITYRGVSSDRITAVFQKHLGKVKLITAVLFILLAVLTILT